MTAVPADFEARHLPLRVVEQGRALHRFHALGPAGDWSPMYFDTGSGSRFNAPDGSFSTLYAAHSGFGAFAETFLRSHAMLLSEAFLDARGYAVLDVAQDLRVAPLHSEFAATFGATATVTAGYPYGLSQTWAKALHDHPQAPDGIEYRSRHDDSQFCVALFGRAAAKLAVAERWTRVLDMDWIYDAMDRYGVGLSPAAGD